MIKLIIELQLKNIKDYLNFYIDGIYHTQTINNNNLSYLVCYVDMNKFISNNDIIPYFNFILNRQNYLEYIAIKEQNCINPIFKKIKILFRGE